ncbi:Maf family protein [Acidisoma cladoniae]|uniref:Maf family protein n=1 Tax=Acidisoma cladoniae TaxID=3040935 RepID=UPI003D9C8065
MTRLILASGSVTRREMLRQAGLTIEVVAAPVDEAEVKASARAEGIDAADTAVILAEIKAQRISRRHPDAVVIGADQMLVCDGTWFDKPIDVAAARAQLLALRGRDHALPTAVVCFRSGSRIWHHVETPRLWLRAFSDTALDAYLAAEGEAVLTTVGGYRVEGPAIQLFDRIEGDWFSILGLPLLPLFGFLRQTGALI